MSSIPYDQELPPDPIPREDEDHALISALTERNPRVPWLTQWNDRRLHSWPASSAEVGAHHTASWQLSEYTALRYWFVHPTPARGDAARRCLNVAIEEFTVAFADELAEASACHELEDTYGHADWGDRFTFGALEREGTSISNDPRGLWPVERKLASMVTFLCRIQPDYTEAMSDLLAQQVMQDLLA